MTLDETRLPELAGKYERTKHMLWVIAYRGSDADSARPYDWAFGIEPPPPVPNPQMAWRTPTFGEYLDRQSSYEENPKQFLERSKQAVLGFRKRRR